MAESLYSRGRFEHVNHRRELHVWNTFLAANLGWCGLGVPILVWLRRWLHAGGTEQFPYPLTATTLQGGSVSRSLLAHWGVLERTTFSSRTQNHLHPQGHLIGVTAFLQSILLTASTDTELQAGQCDTCHPLSPRPYTHGNPSVIRRDTHGAIEGALHGSDLQDVYILPHLTDTDIPT